MTARDDLLEPVAWRYKLDDETARALFRPGWNLQEHEPPVKWGVYGRLITEAEPLYGPEARARIEAAEAQRDEAVKALGAAVSCLCSLRKNYQDQCGIWNGVDAAISAGNASIKGKTNEQG